MPMSQMHSHEDLAEIEVDRLHRSLRISGVSVAHMAKALDVHRNTIGNYLRGKTPLDRRTRIAWAFVTGVPVTWLETGQAPDQGDPGPGSPLPRLDSNQQPSGYTSPQRMALIAA